MVMAGSLTQQNGGAPTSVPLSRPQVIVLAALADGKTAPQIARRLAKGDRKKAQQIRAKLRRWACQPEFRQAIFDVANGNMILALPGVTDAALTRAALYGKPDSVKLVWEATGFHNPKVSHEHSGDIQLHINIPRPERTQDTLGPGKDPESYVDADVVEE